MANGYGSQNYWSEEGWAWKQKNHVNHPDYWNISMWNKADHPVIGVSYYEAEAYASWAGKHLPTEQEWRESCEGGQMGAYIRGVNEFDPLRCNSKESKIEMTTPVSKFHNGVSPYGCFDIAGNAEEWCTSIRNAKEEFQVIRGGSWIDLASGIRSEGRVRRFPWDRRNTTGFRCVKKILFPSNFSRV